MPTADEARQANTVHIPGAPAPSDQPERVAYVAARRAVNARTDEDYMMAYWASDQFPTRLEATEALVEHMLDEARQAMRMTRLDAEGTLLPLPYALELAQLAGAMGTTVASESHLEQVTTRNGVLWSVRRLRVPA